MFKINIFTHFSCMFHVLFQMPKIFSIAVNTYLHLLTQWNPAFKFIHLINRILTYDRRYVLILKDIVQQINEFCSTFLTTVCTYT